MNTKRYWGILVTSIVMFIVTLVAMDLNGAKQSIYLYVWIMVGYYAFKGNVLSINIWMKYLIWINVGLMAIYSVFVDEEYLGYMRSGLSTRMSLIVGVTIMLIPKVILYFYTRHLLSNENGVHTNTSENKTTEILNNQPIQVSKKTQIVSNIETSVDLNEDEKNIFYSKAFEEVEQSNVDKGLWARCFAESKGNENETKSAYIKFRAEKLIADALVTKQVELEVAKENQFENIKKNIGKNSPQVNFDVGMKIYNGYDNFQANPKESFIFLYKAAIGGIPKAQFNLSLMYWKGDGVTQDKAEAYAWSRIAANNVSDAKDNVKFFSANMNASQVIESDRLAKKYVDLIESNLNN